MRSVNHVFVWTMPVGCSKEKVTLGLSSRTVLMWFIVAQAHVSAIKTVRCCSAVRGFSSCAFKP